MGVCLAILPECKYLITHGEPGDIMIMAIMRSGPSSFQETATLLDSVFAALVEGGHARAFLWLALSGYAKTMEELHVRSLAEAVHEVRRSSWSKARKRVPPFEDTYFTVLLPALALLAMSVTGQAGRKGSGANEECSAPRFRVWLARLIHQHLEPPGREEG